MELLYPIPEFVQTELDSRKDNSRRLQTPRTPWFRFISNVKPDGKPEGKILSSGTYEFGQTDPKGGFFEQYSTERGGALRPEPGAESVSIEYQDSYLDVTVKWKCWTSNQFEELIPYFMVPGNTVIVDFGWQDVPAGIELDVSNFDARRELFTAGKVKGKPYTVNPATSNENRPLFPIVRYEKRGQGRYAVFAGQINGFDASYNNDGGFDCQTKFTAPNASMLGLQIRNQYERRNANAKKKKPTVFEYLWEDSESGTDFETALQSPRQSQTSNGGNLVRIDEYSFMSWGFFEEEVLNKHMGVEDDNIEMHRFSNKNTIVGYYPNLLSTDLRKCLVAPQGGAGNGLELSGFKETPFEGAPELPSNRSGYLWNLYLNIDFVKQVFREETLIVDAIERILKDCSESCFGIWNFSVQIEGNMLTVVDLNSPIQSADEGKATAYEFFPYTTDTIVDDFSFNFNLDSVFQAQMFVGTQLNESGGEEDGIFNGQKGVLQEVFGNITDPVRQNLTRSGERKESPTNSVPVVDDVLKKPLTDLDYSVQEDFQSDGTATEEEVKLGYKRASLDGYVYSSDEIDEFKEKILTDTSQNSPRNSNQVIPVTVDLTIQGISGIRSFQSLKIANLPRPFKGGIYQISTVSHEISKDGWTTSLSANFVTANPLS